MTATLTALMLDGTASESVSGLAEMLRGGREDQPKRDSSICSHSGSAVRALARPARTRETHRRAEGSARRGEGGTDLSRPDQPPMKHQPPMKGTHMNIVPPAVEQRINRVDRTPSLVIGIVCAVIALGCVWGLLWSIYGALVLTEYGFSPVALIVNVVLYV